MKVQVIVNRNGWGMSQDAAILSQCLVALSGDSISVEYSHWTTPNKYAQRHFDLNVFIEDIKHAGFIQQAKRNALVPNPEWCWNTKNIKLVGEVWAKTRDCERIFKRIHPRVTYVGWTSADRYLPDVKKEKALVHLAGASSAKGTKEVIAAIAQLPEYRLLLASEKDWGPLPANVEKVGRIEGEAFVELQNRAAIHLCPSSYEGFGHYINEARSVGATIITTNAPPMNELVHRSFGFGCSAISGSGQNLAWHQHVDTKSLVEMIDAAMGLPLESLLNLGILARQAYIADRQDFMENLRNVLQWR